MNKRTIDRFLVAVTGSAVFALSWSSHSHGQVKDEFEISNFEFVIPMSSFSFRSCMDSGLRVQVNDELLERREKSIEMTCNFRPSFSENYRPSPSEIPFPEIKDDELGISPRMMFRSGGYIWHVTFENWRPEELGTAQIKRNLVDERTLVLSRMKLRPSKYRVTYKRGPATIVDKSIEAKAGRPDPIVLAPRGLLAAIGDRVLTKETGAAGVIVGLLVAVLGLLREKIVKGFGSLLDAAGKAGFRRIAELRYTLKYLQAVRDEHRYLKLIGINPAGISRPPLEEVYVSLRVSSFGRPIATEAGRPEDPSASQSVDFRDAIHRFNRLAILGGPGAGKTTALSYILLQFANLRGGRLFGIDRELIPIFVPLRRLSSSGTVLDDLNDRKSSILPADVHDDRPEGYFKRRLEQGECIVLLDGLDEVIDEGTHQQVAAKITSFVSAFPKNRFVITCRIAGWKGLLPEFTVMQADSLSREEVRRFVYGWHRAVIWHTEMEREWVLRLSAGIKVNVPSKQKAKTIQDAIDDNSRRLIHAIERSTRILAIAVNPMLLSLICLVHLNRFILPKGRALLYGQCIEFLIDAWNRSKGFLTVSPSSATPTQKEAILRLIAFDLQASGRSEIGRQELERLVSRIAKELAIAMSAKELIADMELRSGLLVERSLDVFGFSHLTLQEYLVAKHIQLTPGTGTLILEKNLDNQEWREVTLLYSGLVDSTADLVGVILGSGEPTLERLVLAGLCLGESEHPAQSQIRSVSADLMKRLQSELGDANHVEAVIGALSAMTEDYESKPTREGHLLSQTLMERAEIRNRMQPYYIRILGIGRVTRALPVLVSLLSDTSTTADVRQCLSENLTLFGNLALPEIGKAARAYYQNGLSSPAPESGGGDPEHAQIELLAAIGTAQAAQELAYLYPFAGVARSLVCVRLAQVLSDERIIREFNSLDLDPSRSGNRVSLPDEDGWPFPDLGPLLATSDFHIRDDLRTILDGPEANQSVWAKVTQRRLGIWFCLPAIVRKLRQSPKYTLSNEVLVACGYPVPSESMQQIESLCGAIKSEGTNCKDAILQAKALRGERGSSTGARGRLGSGLSVVLLTHSLGMLGLSLFGAYVWLERRIRSPEDGYDGEIGTILWAILTALLLAYWAIRPTIKTRKQTSLLHKFGMLLNPVRNALIRVPYWSKLPAWTNFLLYCLIFSAGSAGGLILVVLMFTEGLRVTDLFSSDNYVLWLFILEWIVFLTVSFFYFRLVVLRVSSVVRLLLVLPEGERALGFA